MHAHLVLAAHDADRNAKFLGVHHFTAGQGAIILFLLVVAVVLFAVTFASRRRGRAS